MKLLIKDPNERGVTLLELLASFVILILIIGLSFPLLQSTIQSSTQIRNENLLRDEADYLLSALYKEMYTLKESSITKKQLPEKGTSNFYFQVNEKKIGFIDQQLFLGDEILQLYHPKMAILPSKIEPINEEAAYEVTLSLKYKDQQQTFKKIIFTINDVKEEDKNEASNAE